jgi:hypothetical protein
MFRTRSVSSCVFPFCLICDISSVVAFRRLVSKYCQFETAEMEFQEKVEWIGMALEKELVANGNQVLQVNKKSPKAKAKHQRDEKDIFYPSDNEVTEPAPIEPVPVAKGRPQANDELEDIFAYSSNEDERPSPIRSVDQSGYNITSNKDMSLRLDEESNETKSSKKKKKNKEKEEEKEEKKRKHDHVEKVKEKKHKKHKKRHQES